MDPRIHQLQHKPLQLPKTKTTNVSSSNTASFQEVLQKEVESLTISKHARTRLQERNIHIQDNVWETISSKVKEAKAKGVTESLVVTKDAALVVSAKNDTVITAMDRKEAASQIFTNINGTILMED
ncbi:flagellar protein [Pontibacillus yanchengensis]|uniref:Flagellar protein n=2 Tax=Pontibacillus yanchengensis TaxID=462910 RepID=A0ACC7V9Z1_9BACI|nr:TIGR02530 family flagellar biosynthesis protein [Pontibacillus yanchengensis]MYL33147.1 flagellar protein [Pontibacillus yanchengensis]MYL52003.1 flagellar protein [Pontibacillus yanchengensis]